MIKSINNALDVYDEIFPYTWFKPKLTKEDLSVVYRLMEKFYIQLIIQLLINLGQIYYMRLIILVGLNLRKLF